MSLFDVLKYPISVPPALGELEDLPHTVLLKFIRKLGPTHARNYNKMLAASFVHNFLKTSHHTYCQSYPEFPEDMRILKQLILEHEDEPI